MKGVLSGHVSSVARQQFGKEYPSKEISNIINENVQGTGQLLLGNSQNIPHNIEKLRWIRHEHKLDDMNPEVVMNFDSKRDGNILNLAWKFRKEDLSTVKDQKNVELEDLGWIKSLDLLNFRLSLHHRKGMFHFHLE